MRILKMTWFMLFLFLSFYYYGAGMVDGFMNYQMYYTAGKCDNWLEYKKIANAIAFPIAAPAMLIPLVGLLLIWLKPPAVPRPAIIISVLLSFITEIFTIKVIWPIHGQLAVAYSDQLMDKLLFLDRDVRKVMQTVNLFVVFYMLFCVMKKAEKGTRSDGAAPSDR